MVWHPCHTHAAKFCVFCEFCGRTAHPNHLCQSVPSVGEKIFPQNAHTEPSGREEPPTDEHGCSQIRRVWHPCHTHAAQFCVFCVFCGRTAHPKYLCSSVPSVGVLSLQEGSVRSVAFVGGSLSNRLPCLRRVLWEVNAYQISSKKLYANPVTCNANIVQAPST